MGKFFYSENDMNELFEKLLILRMPRIGPVRYAALVEKYGSVSAAVSALDIGQGHRDTVMREMERAAALNIYYICDTDADYPAALRAVKNHPPVISVRGNRDTLRCHAVAMVGTRHASATGMTFTADLAAAFAERGIAVVSGMAMGTDSAAHRGALRAAGARQTIAVLAGGADYIWPLENESLYHQILERGAVVSEMPVGFVPNQTNFVQRNRWIAGICDKLILGEADIGSGSMTTARFALDLGREIWAIPSHPADSRAAGPNSLIAGGVAKMCTGAADFFGGAKNATNEKNNLKKTDGEISLIDMLGIIPQSESVLAELVKKTVSEIKRDLVVLELQGKVRKIDGGYIRV